MDLFNFQKGKVPILISMPHCGTSIPNEISDLLTKEARSTPDTDWHIPLLYNFLETLDVSIISSNISRYVVDLNRPPDGGALYPGQNTTNLCPLNQFNGLHLYKNKKKLSLKEITNRKDCYWAPYHNQIVKEISRLKSLFGFVILYDAHSIASEVPNLFSGKLPDLNFGTAKGESCDLRIEKAIENTLIKSPYSFAVNGRFVGGYITRHYGNPQNNIHSVQMEISQINYMSEDKTFSFDQNRAQKLRSTLQKIINILLLWNPRQFIDGKP